MLRALISRDEPPNFPSAMRWLRDYDVLNAEGKFAVPMIERWGRENGMWDQ